MSDIGNVLKELRGKESLREASKRIGISHTYLDTIEKGFDKRSGKHVSPSADTLKMISKAYNYPYKELLILAGYLDDEKEEFDLNHYKNKIAKEFPDIDLMFKDMESLTAQEMKEVYEYIKFKVSQKKKD